MEDNDYIFRVRRGALLLDSERPGWAEAIDIEILDLEDVENCILGQVFGDYSLGSQALGFVDGYERQGCGFTIISDEQWGDYPRLTRAWLVAVHERVGGKHVDYPREAGTLYDCGACGDELYQQD